MDLHLLSLLVLHSYLTAPCLSAFLPAASSCSGVTTDWRSGHGAFVRAWTDSIVQITNDDPAFSNNVTAYFFDDNVFEFRAGEGKAAWFKLGESAVDGWIYGRYEASADSHDSYYVYNISGKGLVFVYPDFRTAIVGDWLDGIMQSGKEVKITGYRCKDDMLELRFSRPRKHLPTLVYTDIERLSAYDCHFVRGARKCVATVMDPLDRRNVYVGKSAIPGANDGLFAKRAFATGAVVVIYAGFRHDEDTNLLLGNMTDFEVLDHHKNMLSLSETVKQFVDVPPRFTSIVAFRATLGHKPNHQFGSYANLNFDTFFSPRFGVSGCLVATRPIARGEELFADYGYPMEDAPQWYKAAYKEYKRKVRRRKLQRKKQNSDID